MSFRADVLFLRPTIQGDADVEGGEGREKKEEEEEEEERGEGEIERG